MVSKLQLCRATQSARASASATVIIASTSTASCSPKIKVDVIGSKPSASPKGLGRSPTIAFPGAVKTFTLSVVSFSPFVPSIWYSFRCQRERLFKAKSGRSATTKRRVGILAAQALTVREIGALSNLDNVTVRIADVAADLAVLGDRLR